MVYDHIASHTTRYLYSGQQKQNCEYKNKLNKILDINPTILDIGLEVEQYNQKAQ